MLKLRLRLLEHAQNAKLNEQTRSYIMPNDQHPSHLMNRLYNHQKLKKSLKVVETNTVQMLPKESTPTTPLVDPAIEQNIIVTPPQEEEDNVSVVDIVGVSPSPSPERIVEFELDPEPDDTQLDQSITTQLDQSIDVSVTHDHDRSMDMANMTDQQLNLWAFGTMKDRLNAQQGNHTITCGKVNQYLATNYAVQSQAKTADQWMRDRQNAIDIVLRLQDKMTSIEYLENKKHSQDFMLYLHALRELNLLACTHVTKAKAVDIPLINEDGDLIKRTRQTYTLANAPNPRVCKNVIFSKPYVPAVQETPQYGPDKAHKFTTMDAYMDLNLRKMKGSWNPETELDVTNCWDVHSRKLPDAISMVTYRLIHRSPDPRHKKFWEEVDSFPVQNTFRTASPQFGDFADSR